MATGVICNRLIVNLVSFIQGLNLQGTPGVTGNIGSNVYAQWESEGLNIQLPAVIVTTQGMTEEEGDSSFEEDYVTYPILILVVDHAHPAFQEALADYLRWRHDIARNLRGLVAYPLLPDCPELHDVRLRNLPIADERIPYRQYVRSGFIALCHTNEPRLRNG
jgi:hypothetical protein